MAFFVDIAAVASSIKTAFDIAKSFSPSAGNVDRNGEITKIQSALADAQHRLIAAQQGYMTLTETVNTLEAEVARLKAWDAEKQRYELQERSPPNIGALAYRVKESMRGSEPVHWLCPTCYADGKKSILQERPAKQRGTEAVCYRCKTILLFRG